MEKIKVNVGYSERSNKLFYRYFDVVECLPLIGEERGCSDYKNVVVDIADGGEIDVCNSDEAFAYNYYVVTEEFYERAEDGEGWDFVQKEYSYVAIRNEIDEEEA